jgi:hypothetical protein
MKTTRRKKGKNDRSGYLNDSESKKTAVRVHGRYIKVFGVLGGFLVITGVLSYVLISMKVSGVLGGLFVIAGVLSYIFIDI